MRTLEDFDWHFNVSIKRKPVFDLATCRFIKEGKDVLLLGPPGVGKSHLVQAIGLQAIKAGYVVLYRSIFDVVRDFLHEDAGGGQDKVLNWYLKPDLLIIDDMGIKQLPKRSGEYLFEIIMRRYETRSTLMTSNRPLEDWGKLLGDVPSATAILDRKRPPAKRKNAPKNPKKRPPQEKKLARKPLREVYKRRIYWLVLTPSTLAGFNPPRDTHASRII
jgi:DNA replication protein DnaC